MLNIPVVIVDKVEVVQYGTEKIITCYCRNKNGKPLQIFRLMILRSVEKKLLKDYYGISTETETNKQQQKITGDRISEM